MREYDAAVLLAKFYIMEYNKYSYAFPTEKTIEKSKWWKFFLKAAKHKNLDRWEASVWVKCQFEKYGKVFPPQISGDNAIEAFEEYKHRFLDGDKDQIKQVVAGISSGLKDVQLWCKRNNDDILDYSVYFDSPRIQQRIKRKEISHYFISVCRSFVNTYGIPDLPKKRREIYKIPNLPKKLHKLMGKEFIRKIESIL